jgi:hypothetical protein
VIDLTETRSIDSTTLGLLAKLSILSRQKVGLLPTVVTTHEDITRLLQSMGFDQVFNIVDRPCRARNAWTTCRIRTSQKKWCGSRCWKRTRSSWA